MTRISHGGKGTTNSLDRPEVADLNILRYFADVKMRLMVVPLATSQVTFKEGKCALKSWKGERRPKKEESQEGA